MEKSVAGYIVQNCSFKIRCKEDWASMEPIKEKVRWCNTCNEAVYQVETIGELLLQCQLGHCVCAMDPAGSDSAEFNKENLAVLGYVVTPSELNDDIPF